MLEYESLQYLRELNMESMILRLTLAMILGGLIGIERERKHRPAGFRTYMLVCLGAALTMILGQYIVVSQSTIWADTLAFVGNRTDSSRMGAQVINGIGFLGAGTILVTSRQEVKGLTTAAGLWSSACMGIATGAGFYECTIIAFILIWLSVRVFPSVENLVLMKSRNMLLYVEFNTVADVTEIVQAVKAMDIRIFDMDFDRGKLTAGIYQANAVITVKLPKKMTHTTVLTELSKLEQLHMVKAL